MKVLACTLAGVPVEEGVLNEWLERVKDNRTFTGLSSCENLGIYKTSLEVPEVTVLFFWNSRRKGDPNMIVLAKKWTGHTVLTSSFFATSLLLNACATAPVEAPARSTSELNEGKTLPDAPGDAGETAPKPEKPQADPTTPAASTTAPDKTGDSSKDEMTVTQDVNVRGGPGMKFEIVKKLKKGSKVTVSAKENSVWSKIGDKAYVPSKFLKSP